MTLLPNPTRSFAGVFLVVIAVSPAIAQRVDFHAPYQDPHFDLHHTPMYDYGARTTHSSLGTLDGFVGYVDTDLETSTLCNSDVADASGRSPRCPKVNNAILQLYIPDGLQVEINGYPTKQQTLGGIHKNSRIYSLDGLSRNRIDQCDIVVTGCDEQGCATKRFHILKVRAGERYEVRYPRDFRGVEPQIVSNVMPFEPSSISQGGTQLYPPDSPPMMTTPISATPTIEDSSVQGAIQ